MYIIIIIIMIWGVAEEVASSFESWRPQRFQRCSVPYFHCSVTDDVIMNEKRNFLGEVFKMQMKMATPEVQVVKHFRCEKEKDTEVYS